MCRTRFYLKLKLLIRLRVIIMKVVVYSYESCKELQVFAGGSLLNYLVCSGSSEGNSIFIYLFVLEAPLRKVHYTPGKNTRHRNLQMIRVTRRVKRIKHTIDTTNTTNSIFIKFDIITL